VCARACIAASPSAYTRARALRVPLRVQRENVGRGLLLQLENQLGNHDDPSVRGPTNEIYRSDGREIKPIPDEA